MQRLGKEHGCVHRREHHAIALTLQVRKAQLDGREKLRLFTLRILDKHHTQRCHLPRNLQFLRSGHHHDGERTCLLQGQHDPPHDGNTADLQQRHSIFFACRCDHRTH